MNFGGKGKGGAQARITGWDSSGNRRVKWVQGRGTFTDLVQIGATSSNRNAEK